MVTGMARQTRQMVHVDPLIVWLSFVMGRGMATHTTEHPWPWRNPLTLLHHKLRLAEYLHVY